MGGFWGDLGSRVSFIYFYFFSVLFATINCLKHTCDHASIIEGARTGSAKKRKKKYMEEKKEKKKKEKPSERGQLN